MYFFFLNLQFPTAVPHLTKRFSDYNDDRADVLSGGSGCSLVWDCGGIAPGDER